MAWVYRIWGSITEDTPPELLYIGMTTARNPDSRFKQHNTLVKNGFLREAKIECLLTPTKADADQFETYLLNTESPLFNKQKVWDEPPEWYTPPPVKAQKWVEWDGVFLHGTYHKT